MNFVRKLVFATVSINLCLLKFIVGKIIRSERIKERFERICDLVITFLGKRLETFPENEFEITAYPCCSRNEEAMSGNSLIREFQIINSLSADCGNEMRSTDNSGNGRMNYSKNHLQKKNDSGEEIWSRNNSGNEIRSRNNSGNETRSRNNSGNETRSRNNSGNEIRSRNNSGNEIRSRNNSGNSAPNRNNGQLPGPGLLQRSESIVQFPSSPPASYIRMSNSSSQRIIKININKSLRESKLRAMREKELKAAKENNEKSTQLNETTIAENLTNPNRKDVAEIETVEILSTLKTELETNELKLEEPRSEPQIQKSKMKQTKSGRKRRALTMPDLMNVPRARTVSEMSEECDMVMPLPVIPSRTKWKSCGSLSTSASIPMTTSKRITIANNGSNNFLPTSIQTSNSSPPSPNSDALQDSLQLEIAKWQDSITNRQGESGHQHNAKTSRNLQEVHHMRLINGHTVIKTNNFFRGGTFCKIKINNSAIANINGTIVSKVLHKNGFTKKTLWQGLQKLESSDVLPSKSAT